MNRGLTPLLAPDSPLDDAGRAIVTELFRGEQRLMAALPTDDPRDPKRLARVLLTRGEMFGQPDAIRTTWRREGDAIRALARTLADRPPRRVILTGCGDSLAVMQAMRLLLETTLGVPCEPVQALDLAYYHSGTLGPGSLVVGLSSSGTTTRTVEAMLVARAHGAATLALSNTAGSALMTQADHCLLIHAERRGWPTQSSTAAMAVLALLGAEAARLAGRPGADALLSAIGGLPDMMAGVLRECDGTVAGIAAEEWPKRMFLYAGGGPAYAAAQFGAVKMKECSPDHAMAVPLEEFHHYNSQKADDPLFLLAPAGPSVPRARDTAEEGRRWRGRIISAVTKAETALDAASHHVLRLPALPESLAACIFTLPVQLFAYHVALEKFRAAGAEIPDGAG